MILHSYMLVYQRVHGQSESNQQRIFFAGLSKIDHGMYVDVSFPHRPFGAFEMLVNCANIRWNHPNHWGIFVELTICPFSNVKITEFQVPTNSPQILVPPQLTDFAASRLYHHRGLGEVVGSSTPDKDAGNRHRGSWCWGTFGNLVISSNCPRIKGKFTATLTYFLGNSMVDFPSNQSIEVSSADADVCRNDGYSPSQKAGALGAGLWAFLGQKMNSPQNLGISGISFIWSSWGIPGKPGKVEPWPFRNSPDVKLVIYI